MLTCLECGGTGGMDSGGMTPWGSGIDIPCPSCVAPIGVNFGPASYQWWHDADWFIEWERLAYGS